MTELSSILREFTATTNNPECEEFDPLMVIVTGPTGIFTNQSKILRDVVTLRVVGVRGYTFHEDGYFPKDVVISGVDVLTLPHDFHTKFHTLVIHNVKHIIFTEPNIIEKRTRSGYLAKLTIADSSFALPDLVLPFHTNMVDCIIRLSNIDARHINIVTPNKLACCIKIEDMTNLTYLGIDNAGFIPHLDIARCPILRVVSSGRGKISLITLANMDRMRDLSSSGAIGTLCANYVAIVKVTGWIHTYVINEPLTPPILPWTNTIRLWWELLGNSASIVEKKVSNNIYYCEGYDINNHCRNSNARMVPVHTSTEYKAPPTKP